MNFNSFVASTTAVLMVELPFTSGYTDTRYLVAPSIGDQVTTISLALESTAGIIPPNTLPIVSGPSADTESSLLTTFTFIEISWPNIFSGISKISYLLSSTNTSLSR